MTWLFIMSGQRNQEWNTREKVGTLNLVPAKDYNDYMRRYMLNLYHKRRAEAFAFLDNLCAHCGSTDELEIDHRDWREKSFPVAKLWSIKREKFLEELKKCQALCKDCHAVKTKTDMSEIKREKGWTNQYGGPGRTPP